MSLNRSPLERREGRVEFLGEQDGPAERELKAMLKTELRRFPSIQRAYLARIGFASDAPGSVALCIFPSSTNDQKIVEVVQQTFSSLFASDAHLDIVFVSTAQEADLQRVCKSFL